MALKSLQKSRAGGSAAIMETVFLGDDLLAWLVLALGGALLVGNVAAIVRPPDRPARRGRSSGRRCFAAS